MIDASNGNGRDIFKYTSYAGIEFEYHWDRNESIQSERCNLYCRLCE